MGSNYLVIEDKDESLYLDMTPSKIKDDASVRTTEYTDIRKFRTMTFEKDFEGKLLGIRLTK